MLPESWTKERFDHMTELARGQVDPKVEPYASMIHIGPENIESNTGKIRNLKTCRESGFISGKYEFDDAALVYSKIRPKLNKVCKPNFNGVCSADMYPIWPKDSKRLNTSYLHQYMLSPAFLHQTVACSMRTGMPKINRADLSAVKLLIPTIEEQTKIAQILTTWDQAIATTEKLIENSKAQKKSLMQQLLMGKKRLPGFSAKWQEYRLGQLFSERKETNQLGLRLLSITQNRGVIYRDDVGRKDTSSEDKSKYKRLCPNDIGYNTMRMWQGVSALSDKEGIVSPAYTIVIPGEQANPLYMSYLFKFPKTIHNFYRHSQGLVSDTWNLKYPNFSEIKVTVPGTDEQEEIASVLKTADKQISNLRLQAEKLNQEKKALMQQLLTGKRRVKLDGGNL